MADRITDYVERLVAEAPPLSARQKRLLREVLGEVWPDATIDGPYPTPPDPRIGIRDIARITQALEACAICGVPPHGHNLSDHKHESLTPAQAADVLEALAKDLR
jgi:hypothetical protein